MKNTEILKKDISNLTEYIQKEKLGIFVPKIEDTLILLNSIFLENSIEFAFTGGVALNLHTGAKLTVKDIDLSINIQNISLEDIINTISKLFGNSDWFYLPEQITYVYNKHKIEQSGLPRANSHAHGITKWPYVLLHNPSATKIDLFFNGSSILEKHAITNKSYTTLMDSNIPKVSTEFSILSRIFNKRYYNKSYEYGRITHDFISKIMLKNIPLDIEFMIEESKKLNIHNEFTYIIEIAKIINNTNINVIDNGINNIV